jgi:methionine-rich copper-binding protein CopC
VTSFALPAALIDPFVTGSTPTTNANIANNPITSITLSFAEAMNAGSFSVADDVLSFTGPGGTDLLGAITGSSWTNSTTLKIDFAPQRGNGAYSFVLSPTVVAADDAEGLDQDGDGTPGEAVEDRFNLNFTKSGAVGPRVTAHTPTGSLSFVSLTQFDMTFSEAMDQTSFSLADISSFTGPGGADLLGQVTGFSWQNSTTLRVTTNSQGNNGTYTLVLGPQVLAALDAAAMDQNADGTPAGAGDAYSAAVTLDRYPGPEGFGYEMNAYPFESLDLVIGQPGVSILVNGSDDATGQINLGANTLNYYGTTYTGASSTVYANPNGLMSFGTSTTNWTNGDLTSSPTQRALAILWDDWRTDGSAAPGATDSAVLYKIDGDRLIVEWSDVCNRTQSQGAVTFQAILQLNTGATPARIIFNYVDTVHDSATYSNGASSSVGIKDTATQGPNRILLSQNNNAHPWVGSGKAILVAQDVIAPTVTNSSFAFVGSHEITFTFDEPMTGFDAADLLLHNQTTTLDVSSAVQAVSYDSGTNTASFTVPGLLYQMLEDGDYTATLGGVTDVSGNPLDGDENLIAGGNYATSLFFLNGDADRDRDVDSDDFNILAGNFGLSPRDFTQGDFTNDALVNSDDFNELATRFGVSLGAGGSIQRSGSAILPPASSLITSPTATRSGSLFGDLPIGSLRDTVDDLLLVYPQTYVR